MVVAIAMSYIDSEFYPFYRFLRIKVYGVYLYACFVVSFSSDTRYDVFYSGCYFFLVHVDDFGPVLFIRKYTKFF